MRDCWSNEGGWKFLLGPERPGGGRRCPFAPKLTRPGTLAPKVASVLMIIVICMQGANIIGMHLWKIIKARQNPTKYCLQNVDFALFKVKNFLLSRQCELNIFIEFDEIYFDLLRGFDAIWLAGSDRRWTRKPQCFSTPPPPFDWMLLWQVVNIFTLFHLIYWFYSKLLEH